MSEFDPKALDIVGHCPFCNGDRRSTVYGSGLEEWTDDKTGVSGKKVFRLARCDGCENFYFQTQSIFSEDYDSFYGPDGETVLTANIRTEMWPHPSLHVRPEWVDDLWLTDVNLQRLLLDAYSALDAELRVFAAIGIRTTFDRASELLGVAPELTFAKKLEALIEKGMVSASEGEFLRILIDAGSAAAHRAWKPTDDQLRKLFLVLEAFLLKSFILPNEIMGLASQIPPKAGAKKKT